MENSAKSTALRERIRILAKDLPENWSPQPELSKEFIVTHLRMDHSSKSSEQTPIAVKAMISAAESLEKTKEAEKARFLPKIGLFGSGDWYGGNRGSAANYTAGAYLQWNVFSASNGGAVSQAEQTALAASAKSDAANLRAKMERFSAQKSAEALEKSLTLMEESEKLLEEQTAIAGNLFKNGAIHVLQLIEVLSRGVDLTMNRTEAELNLAQSRATYLMNSEIEGAPYEN